MTPLEFDSAMGALLRAKPFKPFIVVLKNDRKLEVTNPQRVTFRDGRAYRAITKQVGDEFRAADVLGFQQEGMPDFPPSGNDTPSVSNFA
jgi:hypothetical protein